MTRADAETPPPRQRFWQEVNWYPCLTVLAIAGVFLLLSMESLGLSKGYLVDLNNVKITAFEFACGCDILLVLLFFLMMLKVGFGWFWTGGLTMVAAGMVACSLRLVPIHQADAITIVQLQLTPLAIICACVVVLFPLVWIFLVAC